MAYQFVHAFMIGKRHIATGAFGCPPTLAAGNQGCEAPAVAEQDGLFVVLQSSTDQFDKQRREQ